MPQNTPQSNPPQKQPRSSRGLDGVQRKVDPETAKQQRMAEIAEELNQPINNQTTTNFAEQSVENPNTEPNTETDRDDSSLNDQENNNQQRQRRNPFDFRARFGRQAAANVPGGPAISAKKPVPEKPTPVQNQLKTEQPAGPIGRGANAVGKAYAGAIRSFKNLGKNASKMAVTALRTLGSLYVNPATAPWAWGVTIAIILIGLVFIPAIGIYSASVQSPNSAGKSMPEYQPSYEIQDLLSKIIAQSNAADVAKILTENREKIILVLTQIETDLNDPAKSGFANKDKALQLVADLKKIVSESSATDANSNLKIADTLTAKCKELVATWSASTDTIAGTTLPIKVEPSLGQSSHRCSIFKPYECNVLGNRPNFGIEEFKAGVAITADAADLVVPLDTPVYAPFSGTVKSSGKANGEDLGLDITSNEGTPKRAILNHCRVVKDVNISGGSVTTNQHVCDVANIGVTRMPHLHFELKVNNLDVHRDNKDDTGKELWEKMKKILSGS